MKGVIMKKEELSKISDEQLNKEIDEQEDFLGDESSSTGKEDYVLLEWMYQERENRTNL